MKWVGGGAKRRLRPEPNLAAEDDTVGVVAELVRDGAHRGDLRLAHCAGRNNRRFWALSTPRANLKAPYKTESDHPNHSHFVTRPRALAIQHRQNVGGREAPRRTCEVWSKIYWGMPYDCAYEGLSDAHQNRSVSFRF